jgi:NAD(P)-dependent dehydrogenase (short-subunit alcohol dehydrogenase family)
MNVVVITGGSRGIGAAAAIEAAKRGMGVILTYNTNADAAQKVVATIEAAGGKAVALPLDVGDADSFGAFKEAVIQALAVMFQ